jgi:hypothetical protein
LICHTSINQVETSIRIVDPDADFILGYVDLPSEGFHVRVPEGGTVAEGGRMNMPPNLWRLSHAKMCGDRPANSISALVSGSHPRGGRNIQVAKSRGFQLNDRYEQRLGNEHGQRSAICATRQQNVLIQETRGLAFRERSGLL